MNNMEYLKQHICKQIMDMDSETLYNLCFAIKENKDNGLQNFDLRDFLNCEKCEKLYSACSDDKFECKKRFKKYMKETV